MAHVFVEGPIVIGEDNLFYPYSSVGVAPQDLKYKGERSETRIGDRNPIREFVTIHRGTEGGGMLTTIGADNLLSAYAHVAHDVRIGAHTVLWQASPWADMYPSETGPCGGGWRFPAFTSSAALDVTR